MSHPVSGESVTPPQPSRVLYIRNISDKTTEADVFQYCSVFGNVPEVLLFGEKRHGFVQFECLSAAQDCLAFYQENPLAPAGAKIEFAYSGRDEITHKRDPALNPPNTILLITISNLVYPVTVDVMQQIVSPSTNNVGMARCVIFSRGEEVQALVELASLDDAIRVKDALDGLNIYPGANTLCIQFSSMTELRVKANNSKSFDFTIPHAERKLMMAREADTSARKVNHERGAVPVCRVHGINPRTVPSDLASLFAVYGNVSHVALLGGAERGQGIVQMHTQAQCLAAQSNLNHLPLHGQIIEVEVSSQRNVATGNTMHDDGSIAMDFSGMQTYSRHRTDKVSKMYPPSTALHVSNMPDNTSQDRVLAILHAAGVEVVNFKFLDNLNHIAVVLCSSLENAVQAITRCHNVPIGTPARMLRVGFGAFRPSNTQVNQYRY